MATPSASASYKKKDGTLTIAKDHKSISWIPAAGGAGSAVTVPVQNMTSTFSKLPPTRRMAEWWLI